MGKQETSANVKQSCHIFSFEPQPFFSYRMKWKVYIVLTMRRIKSRPSTR
jgi:hypothetical protein